ncbi:putative glutathione-specific gamma-glutamylcyclotransferase 2 [Thrips palmi]|uniref:glutathione-specific gamma-glutamylcyclotransferase n=1 Tax=Thrips palmi TaxID=161013 RepID=A0A6P9A5Y9_THRPL|nr:putative glutathione-specific gamma-glutamylcyclotransferase 2 [Thrips palmi]XP_034252940.1 putative glutathione-specific gamma-glutamylcyclotransferase 2 [Thrips palmi]XP_034252941.1 putative glutathione-specific gamma-glutamylcyclotransferase 2 [Thrips palmi]
MWVFGYGSLVWKVGFPYRRKLNGYIMGYVRRFYQSSEDHRGVPGKPGLVVTLLPSSNPKDRVWGVAYEIAKEDEEMVTVQLDHREKDGYNKILVTFCPANNLLTDCENNKSGNLDPFELVIYVGLDTNPWFCGPLSTEEMARRIVNARGKSGSNQEYLYNLANSMRDIAPDEEDEHLFSLEAAVQELECVPQSTDTFSRNSA